MSIEVGYTMDLDELVKPQWGVERWLEQALKLVNDEEKQEISCRLDALFHNGLPLKLEHNQVLYAHIFGMLTQLEVVAVQIPLKFLSELTTHKDLEQRMRQQLVDEIFHTAAFLKIANELAMPHAYPPSCCPGIERLCSFIVDEPDVRTVVIMLNLIAEGWIEQLFDVLHQSGVAPTVFAAIMEDEKRHVAEAELYQVLGIPDKQHMQRKLSQLEEEMITNVIFKPKNTLALSAVIGVEGCYQLMRQINDKHTEQIAKLDLHPHYLWDYFMEHVPEIMEFYHDHRADKPVPLTSTRKMLIAAWDNPQNPTMSSEFSIDITRLGFFEKKFPRDTVTGLALQALSQSLSDNPHWRRYICNNEIFEADAAYTGLVVKLPDRPDHLGTIFFRDCHEMTLLELSKHVKHDLAIMMYSYDLAMELKAAHPHLMDIFEEYYRQKTDSVYGLPDIASPIICLSNIGPWGFERVVSPLLPGEAAKLTLAQVERTQAWNAATNQFEIIDRLPVGVSVDHRVFDANMPFPKSMQASFKVMMDRLERDVKTPKVPMGNFADLEEYKKYVEQLLKGSLEYGFRSLLIAGHQWANYGGPREPFYEKKKEVEALMAAHGDLADEENDNS